MEGLFKHPGQVLHGLYQVAVLGKGLAGAGDVRLLEHVPAQLLQIHLAGDGDDGDGVHIGRGNAGD